MYGHRAPPTPLYGVSADARVLSGVIHVSADSNYHCAAPPCCSAERQTRGIYPLPPTHQYYPAETGVASSWPGVKGDHYGEVVSQIQAMLNGIVLLEYWFERMVQTRMLKIRRAIPRSVVVESCNRDLT